MEISEKINRIKEIIVENYHPDKIILFGSCARGDADEQSDIDILVISDREKDLPRYRRGLDVRIKLSEVETPKDILFLYTRRYWTLGWCQAYICQRSPQGRQGSL